jgi:hypothetical protein
MTHVRSLLEELAGIGASLRPAGEQLILRAGHTAIPAELVRRVKEAKADLTVALQRATESRIVGWRNEHPSPSAAGSCAWCRKPETPAAVILPFGTEPTHTWLHAECWPAWSRARHDEAVRALATLGDEDAPSP